MSFLKLRNPNQQNVFNQIQGFRNGNDIIQLLPDVNGDWFIHAGIKDSPIFASINDNLWNAFEEVDTITVEYEFEGKIIRQTYS